jgi:Phosphodiester glycosidase/WD40-like Beta Propeller Repeat
MTMRRFLLVAVSSCALVLSTLPAPPAAPAVAVNGDIAFATGRGGSFEIWAVEADGTSPDGPLVTGPPGSIEVDPAWDPGPSGSLAFARLLPDEETFDLFVKPASGAASRLTDEEEGAAHDRQPDWSVTGMIAFTRSIRSDDTTHVYVVPSGGGTPVRLTATGAPGYDASPAWSPTGTQIAYVSDRTGTPQLWTMNADGTAQTQRTFDGCFVSSPDWSPDRSTIVLERQCPGEDADLYALSTTTWALAPFVADAASDYQPVYSPDGTKVAFTRVEADGDKQLYVANPPPAAGMPTPLSGNADRSADMSPDWGTGSTGAHARVGSEAGPASARHAASRDTSKPQRGGSRSRRVAKGVRFTQMRRARSDVYVLKVTPAGIARIDVALSNDLLPGHERTSRMARRHRAVAAINGDFGMPSGRPSHTFMEDGDLKQVSFAVAPTFAMTADEQRSTFGRPLETMAVIEDDVWPVARWNFGPPAFTDVAAFTPAGGALEVPPGNACAARLVPAGGRRWAAANAGVELDYTVDAVGCSTAPMDLGGDVVVAARPGSDGAILIGSLRPGETVTLSGSVGFPGVLDTVGGIPLLVENGAVMATPCASSLCKRHPRTAIGVTPAGRILMVVVDGRRKDSKGVTLVRLARLMRTLGASHALNLDGGGSSTMVVRGKGDRPRVVNRPSDGSQRRVSSAVLVIKGRDPGEVVGAPPARTSGQAPPPAPTGAGRIAVHDPASTGGLLEAMAEGTFGLPVDLPPPLRRALRAFRSAG